MLKITPLTLDTGSFEQEDKSERLVAFSQMHTRGIDGRIGASLSYRFALHVS